MEDSNFFKGESYEHDSNNFRRTRYRTLEREKGHVELRWLPSFLEQEEPHIVIRKGLGEMDFLISYSLEGVYELLRDYLSDNDVTYVTLHLENYPGIDPERQIIQILRETGVSLEIVY